MFYKIRQKIKLNQWVNFDGHSLPELEMSSYILLVKGIDHNCNDTEREKKFPENTYVLVKHLLFSRQYNSFFILIISIKHSDLP